MKTIIPRVLTTLLTFLCLAAVGQKAQAVVPAPDGCYPNFTTAEGCDALNFLTTGAGNTALGWRSLFFNSTGSFNTGVGGGALALNNADSNTAVGAAALLLNTTGADNTAIGTDAMVFNDTGTANTANGAFALFSNTTGMLNTANGVSALFSNTIGNDNTANGVNALLDNTTGGGNTAVGRGALANNTTGGGNIALGASAGDNLTTGNNNIDIGSLGVGGESNTIRIGQTPLQTAVLIAGISGTPVTGTAVVVDASGQLGVAPSSERFKDEIKPMDKASEAILALKPVTFRYKQELDPECVPQFGLVAEEVEKVNPDLVARDGDGKPYTVRYEAVNAMLVNEFLKQHNAFLQEQRKVQRLEEALDAINERLKEQVAKIERVSAQIQVAKPVARMVSNGP